MVHDKLTNTGLVNHIFQHLKGCVILLLFDKSLFNLTHDVIMYFVYVAPEYSPLYDYENSNGIELLNDNILNIAHAYPDASLILSGDFNARTKDSQDCIINDSIEHIFQDANDYPSDDFSFIRKSKDC